MIRLPKIYRGMGSFLTLWSGQVVSLVGSGMTRFAFIFYAFQTTGSATQVTLVALFSFLPKMLLSPIAGRIVDRIGDRLGLLIAEIGSGLVILTAAVVYFSGGLELWHLYIAAAVAGAVEALQYPAFSSALVKMVRKDQLARADGLLGAARSGSDLAGPIFAGFLIATGGGLGAVFALDALTSVLALVMIVLARVPRRAAEEASDEEEGFWERSVPGVRWISRHEGLRALVVLFFVVNLVGVLGQIILQPMVLARTGGDSQALATVLASVGVGGIVGGLAVSTWGGPKVKVKGLLYGVIAVSVLGQIMLGLGENLLVWCVAGFLNGAIVVVINACNQVIWQVNVPEAQLGRVFGSFIFLAQFSVPIAIASAGPLADHVFEPWAQSSSAASIGWNHLVGAEPGSGMATMLVLAGTLGTVTAIAGLCSAKLRALGAQTQQKLAESTPREPKEEPSVTR